MNWREKIKYYFILGVFRIIAFLPLKVLYIFAEGITLLIYNLGYRKKVVFENLRKSFPKKTDKEIELIARKYYRHLAIMIIENVYLCFISKKDLNKRLLIDNSEIFDDLYKQGKSALVMAGHMGNWEFGGGLAHLLSHTVVGVYKNLSSPVFDKIFYDIRSKFGALPVEMKVIGRKMLELNRLENPYLVFMVADQTPSSVENNHWVKFLNQDTNVFLGSEKLAKKFDLPVIYLEIVYHKKGVYRAVPQVITMNSKETKDFEITERFFNMLEESIKQRTQYWLWSHRRWKHKKTV